MICLPKREGASAIVQRRRISKRKELLLALYPDTCYLALTCLFAYEARGAEALWILGRLRGHQ